MKKFKRVLFIISIAISIIGCKKAGKGIEKVANSKVVAKAVNTVSHSPGKIVKDFNLPSASKKYLKSFSEKEKELLTKDLQKFKGKGFDNYIKANPQELGAYRALSASQNLRIRQGSLRSYAKQIKENPNKIPVIRLGDLEHRQPNVELKRIQFLNDKYKDKNVTFSKRVIDFGNYKVVSLFPEFDKHSLAKVSIPKGFYEKSNSNQFAYATQLFKEEYKANPKVVIEKLKKLNSGQVHKVTVDGVTKEIKGEELLKRQLQDLDSKHGNRIFGFTWHHHEDIGKMELVLSSVHNSVGHTGGNLIWGGLR